jgi:geranylgeranyl pyrophosphate synthase
MTNQVDCAAYLEALRMEIDAALERALPQNAPSIVLEAMRYGLLGGGKRLRPCLTLASAEAVAARDGRDATHARALALPAACAVEFVHSYSLIHDDLPAMDDDALRRGRPTTHVVYGDGMAVLAGDGLLTEAFGLLSHGAARVHAASAPIAMPERRLHALGVLAEAAGALGMVGGQAIDLVAAGRVISRAPEPLTASDLHDMHTRKTGALIRAAATMGAILADADESTMAAIDRYAAELGLAFQIIDDILDVEGSAAELGKTAGKDANAGKPTYPALFGLDECRRLAAECVARAKLALSAASLGGRLGDIADWSLGRRH